MNAIITAIVSGKGGTGKTTTAVFVGAALAALNQKVVLIELSPSVRSADVISGVAEKAVFDLQDVLGGQVAPAKAMVESPLYPGLAVVTAPVLSNGIPPEGVWRFCKRLRPYYDHILLDVASGYGSAFVAAAGVAHRMLLVETPDPIALRDGRFLCDLMEGRSTQLRLVLNRVDPRQLQYEGTLQSLDEAIDLVGAQLLGVIPDSADVRKAATGTLLPLKSREADIYDAIARRLLGQDVPLIMR